MKQTAVEWLAEQMLHPQIFNPYIEQAKEMEKQQIIDAYYTSHISMMNAEEYYNETFKK
jgi:hypothetical protein